MTERKLNRILSKHRKWLDNERGGKRADLHNEDLRDADLMGADLRRAILTNANLCGANLQDADLSGARCLMTNFYLADLTCAKLIDTNARGANIEEAILDRANLTKADLSEVSLRRSSLVRAKMANTDLSETNLAGANLRGAEICDVSYTDGTAFLLPICPKTGSIIGYKVCMDGRLVKLLIPNDAKRSNSTTRQCRCDKADVIDIEDIYETEKKYDSAKSMHDPKFIYKIGDRVEIEGFCDDRFDNNSPGIYFFLSKEEAVQYGKRGAGKLR